MAVTVYKTFTAGEVLTASDLNNSFTQVANNDGVTTGGTITGDFTMSGASIVEAEGVAVASAATTNIWATDGNTVHITGTTTITSFGTAPQAGAWMKVIFDGALTLTHGANLYIPGAANITTAADDFAFVYADTTTQFDLIYFRRDGTALVASAAAAGSLTGATLAAGVTASSLTSLGTITALSAGTGAFSGDITMTAASIFQAEGAAVASAATTDIWAVSDGDTVHVTGTTTITSLGTAPQAGCWKKIVFDGALILTHGANLSLPGSRNITTAADDIAFVYADTTTQFDLVYFPKSAVGNIGLQTIWVPATAMYTRTTNGAASGTVETATSLVMRKTFDFDTSTQEFAQFAVRFPKSWNEGTVTFAPTWIPASGSGGVVFGLAGVALSDDDAANTAFGTAQTSTDTLITAADIHVGPTSAAITIAGTPAAGDWVCFQINRTVADAGDTLAVDAPLLGITLFFTTDAPEDT